MGSLNFPVRQNLQIWIQTNRITHQLGLICRDRGLIPPSRQSARLTKFNKSVVDFAPQIGYNAAYKHTGRISSMNLSTLIARLQDAAAATRDDARANLLSALAVRLSHQGAPFEKPLTRTEIQQISQFTGI